MAQKDKDKAHFTGMVGNVITYTRKDSDKLFMRTKGSLNKKRIAKAPEFANTRKQNSEFGGCSSFAANIKHNFVNLQKLSDMAINLKLAAIAKIIQQNDRVNEVGKRSIELSKQKEYLVGFNFNKLQTFNTLFTGEYNALFNRQNLTLTLNFLPIIPHIHLPTKGDNHYYRWYVEVVVISDSHYEERGGKYQFECKGVIPSSTNSYNPSPWITLTENRAAERLEFNLEVSPYLPPITDADTFVVGLGIEFGKQLTDNLIVATKQMGAAKIICVG